MPASAMENEQKTKIETKRITRANLLWSCAIWMLVNVNLTYEVYSNTKIKIDASSQEHFGTSISSTLSFAEVMRSADYGFAVAAFLAIATAITFLIPLIVLVWLGKKYIVEETHAGWKRTAIVVPVTFALGFTPYILLGGIDLLLGIHIPWIFLVIPFLLIGLSLVVVIRWVINGFEKA